MCAANAGAKWLPWAEGQREDWCARSGGPVVDSLEFLLWREQHSSMFPLNCNWVLHFVMICRAQQLL